MTLIVEDDPFQLVVQRDLVKLLNQESESASNGKIGLDIYVKRLQDYKTYFQENNIVEQACELQNYKNGNKIMTFYQQECELQLLKGRMISLIKQGPPPIKLILTDCDMPIMNGFQLAQKINEYFQSFIN